MSNIRVFTIAGEDPVFFVSHTITLLTIRRLLWYIIPTINHEHEAYADVLKEAQRGCDLHGRDAVEISVVQTAAVEGLASIKIYEFLFACVERQEASEGEQG